MRPECTSVAAEERVDAELLGLLLEPAALVWAVDDLVRDVGDRVTLADSLARLYAAGLVHRIDPGFVFAHAPLSAARRSRCRPSIRTGRR